MTSPEPTVAKTSPVDCPFCQIVCGTAPAEIVQRWDDALAIVPLDPVTPGHVLIIPNRHVSDALEDPDVAAAMMRHASALSGSQCNIITSAGPYATQTVFHLHLHVVPRRRGDGLRLPWTDRTAADVDRPADGPTTDELAELWRLNDAATPGPWDHTLDERAWSDQTGEWYAQIDWTICRQALYDQPDPGTDV